MSESTKMLSISGFVKFNICPRFFKPDTLLANITQNSSENGSMTSVDYGLLCKWVVNWNLLWILHSSRGVYWITYCLSRTRWGDAVYESLIKYINLAIPFCMINVCHHYFVGTSLFCITSIWAEIILIRTFTYQTFMKFGIGLRHASSIRLTNHGLLMFLLSINTFHSYVV